MLLVVGNGGKVTGAVLDADPVPGAVVPVGAVRELVRDRVPERGPLGALKGTEPLEDGAVCEAGGVPFGAVAGDEDGPVPMGTDEAVPDKRVAELDTRELV